MFQPLFPGQQSPSSDVSLRRGLESIARAAIEVGTTNTYENQANNGAVVQT